MPIRHTVKQGESIPSIAFKYGMLAEHVWNDPANAELKELRKSQDILYPGDIVVIPDKRLKKESRPTGRLHRFRVKNVPAKTRFQIFDNEKPCADMEYTLEIEGEKTRQGKTDKDGVLETYVPPDARRGKLTIGPDKLVYEIEFGLMDPITETVGVQKRLNNLGFICGEENGQLNEETREALRQFQRRAGLEETGRPDEETLKALSDIHDVRSKFPAEDEDVPLEDEEEE